MGIKALGYVVVETAKPEEWNTFLTQFAGAMRAPDAADGAALYRVDDRVFRFRIEAGTREWFVAAGYELTDRAALDALAVRIGDAARPVEWADANEAAGRGAEAMFRTSDPAGNGLEFYCGDARSDKPFVSPIGVPEFLTGDLGMGHAVFSAPDFEETIAFHRDVVGFHETDMPRFHLMGPDAPSMGFAFLHADNGRHHSIAFGEGPVPPSGAVHIMLELPDLIEVGKAHDRMKRFGYPESATLGRHVNDETTGFYVQTPSGFDLEIGCDSLIIDPASWEVTKHEGISVWGHEWAWQKALKEQQEQEKGA
ncbi:MULTISPECIES: VOC family protein [unclassified Novosphingobium]|uniref:VOC family protein n=1 Tax=unclassified Novosphingobium TaxID=2644732 RepID=UPI00020EF948|nr:MULTISPECIES: VOC family protein [unclassified Novosphingobium]GFM28871.1 glyoxalase/bleomycin resistance protein/dioxygenase [Novosphingobium sp. PY1]CCA90253.1 glyoxalase/bleomycin resistance protein/dioxygenase [Novosphingobium sp. PP1Y]